MHNPNWGGPRPGAGRPPTKGPQIIRGHGVEVGIMQTEIPCKPEAWLYWMEGRSLTSERGWSYGTKGDAVQQLNVWLENIGLALEGDQIVEH